MIVRQLLDALVKRLKNFPRAMDYSVVAVLNPNDGPDEVLLKVERVEWDHNLGVMRLEIGE